VQFLTDGKALSGSVDSFPRRMTDFKCEEFPARLLLKKMKLSTERVIKVKRTDGINLKNL
jgi:hypothetical protein